MNNPAAVSSGTYTFTNVTTSHTIAATFTANVASAITVTAPTAGGTYNQGAVLPVAWSADQPVAAGEFGIWAVSSVGGWYGGSTVAASGATNYTGSATLNVPAGAGYQIAVTYRPTAGSGAWTIYSFSGAFTVAGPSLTSIAITAPAAGGTYPQGSSLPVAWTPNSATASGEFALWVVSSTGWYGGSTVAANGSPNYTGAVTLNVPSGTGYQIAVTYRPTVGSGAWSVYSYSGAFDVGAVFNSISVTAPTGGGSYAAGSALPVSWTPNVPPVGGEFALWVVSSGGGWYGGSTVAADGSPVQTGNVTLNVPVGPGYQVAVTYRPTTGVGAWTIYSFSSGTFTVN